MVVVQVGEDDVADPAAAIRSRARTPIGSATTSRPRRRGLGPEPGVAESVLAQTLPPAISVATSIARSIPSVTNVNGASSRGQPSGTVWVTTRPEGRSGGYRPNRA